MFSLIEDFYITKTYSLTVTGGGGILRPACSNGFVSYGYCKDIIKKLFCTAIELIVVLWNNIQFFENGLTKVTKAIGHEGNKDNRPLTPNPILTGEGASVDELVSRTFAGEGLFVVHKYINEQQHSCHSELGSASISRDNEKTLNQVQGDRSGLLGIKDNVLPQAVQNDVDVWLTFVCEKIENYK